MEKNYLFWIGLILLIAYINEKLAKKFSYPKVTGYILIGIVLSPSTTNILPKEFLSKSEIFIDITLSLVAFMIGGSLKWSRIKALGSMIAKITIFQAEGTFLITTIGLYFLLPFLIINSTLFENWQFYLIISLFLGALASTTAPATTLSIINEYKAKGVLTTTILSVVAADDSLALINFTIAMAINSIVIGTTSISANDIILSSIIEIFFSIIIGILVGFILTKVFPIKTSKPSIMLIFASIFLLFSISKFFELDELLSVMVAGIIFANFSKIFDELYLKIEKHYLELIFAIFFTISGTFIDIEILKNIWQIVFIYILVRAIGKIGGAYLGATIANAPDVIKNNIGFALLPQAGIAVGLALIIYDINGLEKIALIVSNIIIASATIHELFGPLFTKFAIVSANEVQKES